MSENNQPFDRYEENAGSAEPSVDAAAENIDPLTDQSDVGKAGTCRRVANAALVGAGVGAVAGAFAAALTGKGVADGVKAIVDGAVDTVKEAAENLKSTIIEGAENTVKGVAYGVNSTVEEGDIYQVSTPVEKAGVVERTPPVEATRPVAPGNKGDETNNVANNATSSDALLQMLLNQVGTELARSFYEQLPAVVLAEIQRLATNPTLEEKQWITDRWAKALEPLAMAMIVSAQSYKTGTPLTETNGYHKQVNHQETPI